jgi:beta-phosphoglucomutase-like phosphatase (HAD superfamily)
MTRILFADEKAIGAVVFDLDGVLVDSESVWDAARREVVARNGGRWQAGATRATYCWGNITPDGKADCLVTLKNGDHRAFWDNELMWPYYKAWLRRKDKEDQKPKTQILAAMCGHVSEVPIGA